MHDDTVIKIYTACLEKQLLKNLFQIEKLHKLQVGPSFRQI